MKKLLILLVFSSVSMVFAGDVYFIKPVEGDSADGTLTIQIEAPRGNVNSVRVWIEQDFGRERVVWRGKLTKNNNFTTTVDVSKYEKGKYEIQAEYYIGREDYDGDVTFWVD